MASIVVVDATSGETLEREATAAELENIERVQAESKSEKEKRDADKAARDAAIAHAKSLGFTDEMIAVMYPGLTV